MKHENKLKEYETFWTCNFCGKEFKTKEKLDKHKLTCKKNQTKQNLFWIFILFLVIYFLTYFISNSYAQSSGLPTKDLLQPQKWFSSKENITPTPTIINFPVEKLELQNVKYNGKVLTGTILNKGDKPAFNTKLSLKISKDRSVWSIAEQHDFIVQYKIEPNQSVKFSENFKTTKINPWTATAIVESKYYNGENISTPTIAPTSIPKKIIKPTIIPIDTEPIVNCNISANCGGGTRKIKQSECNNGTCCQIGSNWIFYTSKQKCIEDQNINNSNNYVYPTIIPTSTYRAQPTSAPIPTATYVAPTSSYIAPTPNQDYLNQCISGCRSTGDGAMKRTIELCTKLGTLNTSFCNDDIWEVNEITNNCINNCNERF